MSELELRRSAEDTAAGLTSDLNAVYGMGGLMRGAGVSNPGISLFGARGAKSGNVASDVARHYSTPPR